MKELKKVMKVMKNDFGWSGNLLKEQEDFVKDLINATKKVLTLNGVGSNEVAFKDKETISFEDWVDTEGYYEIKGNWFNKHGYNRDMKKVRKWYELRDCLK